MKILVTGSSGYLGAWLCHKLSEEGHDVTAAKRIKTHANSHTAALRELHINWDNPDDLLKMCQGQEVIIHAAGMSAKDCAKDPDLALQFNGVRTSNLIDSAVKSGTRKFVYLSSVHVYSDPLAGYLQAQSIPKNNHPYSISKIAGEKCVLDSIRLGNIDGAVIRLANTFGPPYEVFTESSKKLFVNELFSEISKHKKMTIKTNPHSKRDFIPISSALRQIVKISTCDINSNFGNIFNVASTRTVKLLEMAEQIRDFFWGINGRSINIEYPDGVEDEETPNFQLINHYEALGKVELEEFSLEFSALEKYLGKAEDYKTK